MAKRRRGKRGPPADDRDLLAQIAGPAWKPSDFTTETVTGPTKEKVHVTAPTNSKNWNMYRAATILYLKQREQEQKAKNRNLRQIEDMREYHPEGKDRPPKNVSGARSGLETDPKTGRIRWTDRLRLAVCIRRKTRKEVLHALRLTGKGQGSKLRRRTWRSDIGCK